jgi:putative molybdopterin biosynthesis protein
MRNPNSTELMQVREVARYLGINEKKIYFLAKAGKIPSTRVTGKWTFPKNLIDRWIEESASGLVDRPRHPEERSNLLIAGSDDPGLGILYDLYAARTRPASLFMATVGSSAGVAAIKNGVADLATAHLLEPARPPAGKRNAQNLLPVDSVVVALFHRELGLLLPPGNPQKIKSIRDVGRPGVRFVNRQPGSGTRIYLDQELARARLGAKQIVGYDDTVSTHMEAGLRVLRGEADVTLATRTTAALLRLEFLFLTRERFDILARKERFFTQGIQTLLGIVGSREFRERVGGLGGYDVTESGRIVSAS